VGEDIVELQTLWQKLALFHQTASYAAKKTWRQFFLIIF
jgi:hypothetical protein